MRHTAKTSPPFQSFQMAVGAITVFDASTKNDPKKAKRTAAVPIEEALMLMLKLIDIEDEARANTPSIRSLIKIQRIVKHTVALRLAVRKEEEEKAKKRTEEVRLGLTRSTDRSTHPRTHEILTNSRTHPSPPRPLASRRP